MSPFDEISWRVSAFFGARCATVAAVYVFGSVVRGEDRPDSDVDVGVLFTTPPLRTLEGQPYAFEADLEHVLGRPVDLVALNDAPVDLKIRVLRTGRLVLEVARAARIKFEVDTRNEAFDLEPVLERYRAPVEDSR